MQIQKASKLLFIVMLYTCCMFFEACDPYNCSDFTALPYIAFDSIKIEPNAVLLDEMTPLEIDLTLEGMNFVAFQQINKSSIFSTSMYGCTPAPPGYNGFKNPLTSIEITAAEDFDDMHLAGESLNDLFEIESVYFAEGSNLAVLNTAGKMNDLFGGETDTKTFILENGYPTMPGDFHFFMTLTFESGASEAFPLEMVTFN